MYCTYRVQKNPFNGKAGYYRLLLLVVTMHSRLVTKRGNHVCLPQVGGQKRKPQIDGTYRSGICIYRVKKILAIFDALSLDRVYSQHLVTIFWSTCLWSSKWKSVHVYLQSSSCGFVTYIIQICHNIHVDLLSSSCVFVTNVIQICHDIPVDLL